MSLRAKQEQRNDTRTFVLALALAASLTACGGGGGGGAAASSNTTPTAAPVASTPAPPVATSPAGPGAADLAFADRLYKGDQRTPAGFALDARPASVTGTVSTRHLKNSDFATGPQSAGPTFEVCTNDMAQALDWSERQAAWNGQYSDMVEVTGDEHFFEVVRVPRSDVTALVRHRVFRCDYLDRSASDLRTDQGSAGLMNQRPLNADELEALSEYLWQFTQFNNSDYAVESSTGAGVSGALTHTIRLGQLVRGAPGACDTVHVSDWTHTMNATNGALTRTLTAVRSFEVRSSYAGSESCGA